MEREEWLRIFNAECERHGVFSRAARAQLGPEYAAHILLALVEQEEHLPIQLDKEEELYDGFNPWRPVRF